MSEYAETQRKLFYFGMTLAFLFSLILTFRDEPDRCTKAVVFNPNALNMTLNPDFNKPAKVFYSE